MNKRPELHAEVLLAELLEQCCREKRTGLLTISVSQSALFPLRIYLDAGSVSRLSFGPIVGSECLELLPYYSLGLSDYLDRMRAPREKESQLSTDLVIASIKMMGKTVRMRRWLERR